MGVASRGFSGVLLTLFLTYSAAAQDWTEDLLACGQITAAADRLACYDGVAGRLSGDEPKNVVAVASPPPPAAEPEPEPAEAGSSTLGEKYLERPKRQKKEKPADVDVVVTKVDRDARGRMRYYLENGQIWRQAEDRSVSKPRSIPTPAKIKVGFLGSHAIRIDGTKSSIKVRRVK